MPFEGGYGGYAAEWMQMQPDVTPEQMAMVQDMADTVGGMDKVHPGMLPVNQQPPECGLPPEFDSENEGHDSSEDEHIEDYHIDGYHPVHIK